MQGFLSSLGERAWPSILGKNSRENVQKGNKIVGVSPKGERNLRSNLTFWGKMQDFKENLLGEGAFIRPLL